MSRRAVVDPEVAFVVASLVGVASLLWMPPLSCTLYRMLVSLLYADDVLCLSDVVVAVCCHSCCSLLVVVEGPRR